jgi:hypothetical protein
MVQFTDVPLFLIFSGSLVLLFEAVGAGSYFGGQVKARGGESVAMLEEVNSIATTALCARASNHNYVSRMMKMHGIARKD